MFLTVFTPTYNRAKHLKDVFDSLCRQKYHDFEWLVIDDGSSDNTSDVVQEMIESNPGFEINYHHKSNGGKHTAINMGAEKAKGEFFLFLDSDDRLCDNALDRLSTELGKISEHEDICGIICNRLAEIGTPLGKSYPYEITESNLRLFQRDILKGDYAWCIKTKVLRNFPSPVYENERFMTEAVILNRIGNVYKIKYLPLDIEIGGYNIDGLSIGKTDIFKSSPLGYMLHHKEWMAYKDTPLREKLRSAICYWKYIRELNREIPYETRPNTILKLSWPFAKIFYAIKDLKGKLYDHLPNSFKTILAKFRHRDSHISISCIIEDIYLEGHNGINNYVHVSNSKLGRYTYINNCSTVINSDIGSFTSIGPSCVIGVGEHPSHTVVSTSPHIYSKGRLTDKTLYKGNGMVGIGNDVWIGANVTVRPGVKIGDGAIIGANSVVISDVPSYTIYAGCPAKFIKYRFSDNEIKELIKFRWWEKDEQWIRENISSFRDIKDFINVNR